MRRFLYRIFPASWVPYLLHTRPRAWFIVIAHMSIGFFLATGANLTGENITRWLLAALVWGILGNGGTLALNSAFDRDEGDIGYLDNPPPVPNHLALFAVILMGLGLPIAYYLGWRFLIATIACFLMSILYSVPPFRFKARAGLDVLINSTGFGALTIYAGWASANHPTVPPIINVAVAFFFFFLGFYPLSQIYQMGEDSARGDNTLSLALGKQNALLVACFGVGAGFAFLLTETINHYMQVRSLGLILAFIAWALVLIPWYINYRKVDVKFEKRGFYLALYAWALTDIAVALAMMPV
jgi:lycopene elongase/hydratase (dihydrobisanhydrobacterioruberin-forming)